MKTLSFFLFLAGVAATGHAAKSVPGASDLASGKVVLKSGAKLESGAKGIRTLFLSIYDSSQKDGTPMPYGAVKVEVKADAKGEVAAFTLNSQTMMIMSGGDAPAVFDIKAKLDKDASAGRDAAGDLVGWRRGVKRGTANVTVEIDKLVE